MHGWRDNYLALICVGWAGLPEFSFWQAVEVRHVRRMTQSSVQIWIPEQIITRKQTTPPTFLLGHTHSQQGKLSRASPGRVWIYILLSSKPFICKGQENPKGRGYPAGVWCLSVGKRVDCNLVVSTPLKKFTFPDSETFAREITSKLRAVVFGEVFL